MVRGQSLNMRGWSGREIDVLLIGYYTCKYRGLGGGGGGGLLLLETKSLPITGYVKIYLLLREILRFWDYPGYLT